MLDHRRVNPSIKLTGTHLYTWVERGTVRVKCLAQEHNAMSPARTRTRTTCSAVEYTKHKTTAPPTVQSTERKRLTYLTPSLGIEPWPHWWEAIALTTIRQLCSQKISAKRPLILGSLVFPSSQNEPTCTISYEFIKFRLKNLYYALSRFFFFFILKEILCSIVDNLISMKNGKKLYSICLHLMDRCH